MYVARVPSVRLRRLCSVASLGSPPLLSDYSVRLIFHRFLFYLRPQFPHDCSDPACCSFFATAKIPRGLHVPAFGHSKCARAMFDGKGSY